MLYIQAVISAMHKNPNIAYNPRNKEEIDAIQVSLKERHKPYKVFFEFLCTTNNNISMPYTNPLSEFDLMSHGNCYKYFFTENIVRNFKNATQCIISRKIQLYN